MSDTNPIGRLILLAEGHAKIKKSQTHTQTAPCGCRVTVSWFSENSTSNKIERCSDHPARKERP